MNTLTKEQCRKLVRENGLDWQRGYGVGEDDTNYFEFLINAAFALGVAQGIQQQKDFVNNTIPQRSKA